MGWHPTLQDLHDRDAIPVWHTVCRWRLRQMTFGHAELINALGLWYPSEPYDTLLGAFICSRSAKEARAAFDTRRLKWLLRWKAWRLGAAWDWRWSASVWREFIEYHTEEPFAVQRDLGGTRKAETKRPINTPWLSHIRAYLLSKCGYRPCDMDDAPLGRGILDYFATLEIEGAVSVSSFTRREYAERRRTAAAEEQPEPVMAN